MQFTCIHFPKPLPPRIRLRPVFLPNFGCLNRCSFCDQQKQTGKAQERLEKIFSDLASELEGRCRTNAPALDIGFYGGTFTALPGDWAQRFVALAARFRERGAVAKIRCSTRPDGTAPLTLAALKTQGLDIIELGIQSFNNDCLQKVNRGYPGNEAETACRRVREAGLKLGVHLMSGLPGQSPAVFLDDVRRTVRLAPDMVRIHPTVVLAGTPLEKMYLSGEYTPPGLAQTLELLGLALLSFWRAEIDVIRVGVSPEEDFVSAITAGPWHASLGQRAASRALYHHIRARLACLDGGLCEVRVPRRHWSDFWGWKGEMLPLWEKQGITKKITRSWNENFFLLKSGEQINLPKI